MLYFSGYELKDSEGKQEVETSNGIIMVETYDVRQLECSDIIKDTFKVKVYDFLAHGIASDYDAVIGLDFLKNNRFCIDIFNGEISVDI